MFLEDTRDKMRKKKSPIAYHRVSMKLRPNILDANTNTLGDGEWEIISRDMKQNPI